MSRIHQDTLHGGSKTEAEVNPHYRKGQYGDEGTELVVSLLLLPGTHSYAIAGQIEHYIESHEGELSDQATQ